MRNGITGGDTAELRERFRELHRSGTFVMPNPWDVGSARILESMGFGALATTSSGFAESIGRDDYGVTRDELLVHVAALTAAISMPLNVDAERCFADDPRGVAETVELVAQQGAAGCSIEDWDNERGEIDPLDVAVERVAAAAGAARAAGIVLTARAENHLHGVTDLEDTIRRLTAYRDAGAEVVYAPGLVDREQIERVVKAVDVPLNVLLRPNGPEVQELAALGVRRISTGGALANAAYDALRRAAAQLQAG